MSPFDYRKGIKQEWYETDGRSSWSAGTASGPNTRRGHALFGHIAEDGSRWVLVNHVEEWITLGGKRIPLASTVYFDPGAEGRMTVHPKGYQYLTDFTAFPHPRWTYQIEGHRVTKAVRPVKGRAGLLVEYTDFASNGSQPQIWMRPMISGRRPENLHIENPEISADVAAKERSLRYAPYRSVPGIHLFLPPTGTFTPNPVWYRRVRLISSPRDEEDLFSPGEIRFTLTPAEPSGVFFSTAAGGAPDSFERHGIFSNEEALPPEPAAAIRRTYWYSEAPTPGCAFLSIDRSDGGAPLEEALYAILLCAEQLNDDSFLRLIKGCRDLMNSAPLDLKLVWTILLAEAARRGIASDEDALPTIELIDRLAAGRAGGAGETRLLRVTESSDSWWGRHDAAGAARIGYPIDIQALWINALASAEILERVHRPDRGGAERFGTVYHKASDSVKRLFWNQEAGTLHDSLTPTMMPSPRVSSAPIVLQALRFDVFSPSRARATLQSVRRRLGATSPARHGEAEVESIFGLRAFENDETAWPWLLGFWWKAFARHGEESLPVIPLEGMKRLLPRPTELFLPYSLKIAGETAQGGVRLEFDRPSVLSLAAYLLGRLTAKP